MGKGENAGLPFSLMFLKNSLTKMFFTCIHDLNVHFQLINL